MLTSIRKPLEHAKILAHEVTLGLPIRPRSTPSGGLQPVLGRGNGRYEISQSGFFHTR